MNVVFTKRTKKITVSKGEILRATFSDHYPIKLEKNKNMPL